MKTKLLIFVFMSIALLYGCCKEGALSLMITPEDKSIIDATTIIYTDEQLMDIVMYSGSSKELNEMYPFEFLRYYKETDMYAAAYLGNQKVAIKFFGSDKNAALFEGGIYAVENHVDDFLSLSAKNTLKDVQNLDPNGDYVFLYVGSTDHPKVSTHFTLEGYIVHIQYDDNYYIEYIEKNMF